MKSRIITDKGKIVLSIGMIVKNEEKVLRRCLESLKPLMSSVKCELIIADTGSNDSTVDIAKEYTDNVYHFEWINDFAAARNSTIDRANGIWYMFIDADEYFDEDVNDMIKFFSIPELYNKYNTLQIYVRSYCDEAKKEYADCRLPRIHKLSNNPRFEGKIHEAIVLKQPCGYFDTILHHTGYVYTDYESSKKKKNRNLVLLRDEYNVQPEDQRTLCHIIDSCIYEPDELKTYVDKALDVLKKDNTDIYSNILYMQTANYYASEPERALSICDEYFRIRENYNRYSATVALHLLRGNALFDLKRYDEAYEEHKEYISLYRMHNNGELDETDLTAHPVIGVTASEFYRAMTQLSRLYNDVSNYKKALNLLKEIDIHNLDNEQFVTYIDLLSLISINENNWDELVCVYEDTLLLDEIKFKYISNSLESIFYCLKDENEKKKFINCFSELSVKGKFADFMRIINKYDKPEFMDELISFINNVDTWSNGYSEAIYLALKNKIDISDAVLKMKVQEYCEQITHIANSHSDFAEVVVRYGIPEGYMSSIKQFYWLVDLNGEAVYRAGSLNDEMKYELYSRFVNLLADYVMNIYNPEFLNDDDVEVLPNLHKFGFYMYQANRMLSLGDKIGYIRGLKKALLNCESMKGVIEFFLNKFKCEL